MRYAQIIVHSAMVMLVAETALAQSADQTGTGGGPISTAKAPYTTATGGYSASPRYSQRNQNRQSKDEGRAA